MKLTTIATIAIVTIFLAIMANKACATLSDYAADYSSAQKTLLDANI